MTPINQNAVLVQKDTKEAGDTEEAGGETRTRKTGFGEAGISGPYPAPVSHFRAGRLRLREDSRARGPVPARRTMPDRSRPAEASPETTIPA